MPVMPTVGLVDRANAISLLGDTVELLEKHFVLHPQGAKRRWNVAEFRCRAALYEIVFEDEPSVIVIHDEERLVDLIVQSRLLD